MDESRTIDFWFLVGSTYTYLSVSRMAAVEKAAEVRFRWRPFNARAIMREMDNIPFATKPIKLAYMWRDVERRAGLHALPITMPVPYPLTELALANQVAVLASVEGWCPDYVRATYRRWFNGGGAAGSEPNLSASLKEIGQDPARVIAAANAPETVQALDAATDEARALGIFGSPTFVVGRELFWGDDRMEDAIRWAKAGTLAG
jgi:2-hydroxychromene-2-carboxylate isomerase